MIGVVGFLAAMLAVGAFAYTVHRTYVFLPRVSQWALSFGYYLLAICMGLWSVALVYGQQDASVVTQIIYISDVLLMAATVAMATLLISSISPLTLAVLSLIAALVIIGRIILYPVEAHIEGGILFFGLEGGLRMVITGIFLFIWLPAGLVAANAMRAVPAIARLSTIFAVMQVALAVLTVIFLASYRYPMIIAEFIAIIVMFGCAAVANNFMYSLLKNVTNGKNVAEGRKV